MSLWLCLRLSNLPLECLSRETERPTVIIQQQRVVSCNDVAASAGVTHNQSTATVHALLSGEDPLLLERDIKLEQRTLERLATWAYSITPTLQVWYSDSLQLEIGSCLRLHGQLPEITERLKLAMLRRGLTVALAVAHNRPAAWLLTHRGDDLALDPSVPLLQRLGPLSIELSHFHDEGAFTGSIARLKKAGIHHFNQLLSLPNSAVGKRCGKAFSQWLSQVSAHSDDAHRDFQPPPYFYDALWFGFEVRNSNELEPAMAQLLDGFCRFLRTTQLSAQVIEWQLLRNQGAPQPLIVRSSDNISEPSYWLTLSRLKLEGLTIGEDIEGLALQVQQLTESNAVPDDLFQLKRSNEPLHNLTDRLRSRLGLLAVSQLALRDAHLPEHSQHLSSDPLMAKSETAVSSSHKAQRPFWLFEQPQPVHMEGGQLVWQGPLEIIYGPERIEDNWWQQPISRDYYIAQDGQGQPLWLFQDRRSRRWYVHGVLP